LTEKTNACLALVPTLCVEMHTELEGQRFVLVWVPTETVGTRKGRFCKAKAPSLHPNRLRPPPALLSPEGDGLALVPTLYAGMHAGGEGQRFVACPAWIPTKTVGERGNTSL